MRIQNKTPLLSICIPTYNRALFLRGALENITHDEAFDEDIEIVISDNASTDETKDVGEEYASKFGNIKYFRNEENIRDANFKLALSRGTGLYRKLSNDTLRYKAKALTSIKKSIKKIDQNTALFFYNDISFVNKKDIIHDTSSFLSQSSFYVGGIGNFGLWQQDIDCLNVEKKYTDLQFAQVAWTFEIVKKHTETKIIYGDFFYTDEPLNKASYNLFKVHINNLLTVYKCYEIKRTRYEIELYRNFRYYYLPYIYHLVFCKRETSFNLEEWHRYLLKFYWFRIYIYPFLLKYKIKSLFEKSN